MTGLRTYTTLDPNQWRFPQWKEGIYYPAGSFVAVNEYNPIDSELPIWSYWVAVTDISAITDSDRNKSNPPTDSDSDWNAAGYATIPWIKAFDTTSNVLNAQVIADVAALKPLLAILGIDSDIGILYSADSDLRIKDSELGVYIQKVEHDSRAKDSEQDSEIFRVEHNFKAADSDIYTLIYDHDSENRKMHDSDRHDRKAADSDLQTQIFDNDSDILMEIHDRKAADSDLRTDIDSDLLVLHIRDDSDSDKLVNFIHRYEERDSDINVKFAELDSDIRNVKPTEGVGGFPVGAIQAFASTEMPVGFRIADGSTFDALAYPDLFTLLGVNILPDLRNQFLRGWNNDSDGFGNARAVLSQQDQDLQPHRHRTVVPGSSTGGGINADNSMADTAFVNQVSGNANFEYALGDRAGEPTRSPTSAITEDTDHNPTGNDETRPTNVSVVYGIAMYNGAGVIYDSDIIQSVLQIMLRDRDSDINMLLNRTNYHTDTFAPTVNVLTGSTYDVGVDSQFFEDIDVMLNGVSVSQWTVTGSVFTLNFALRANTDVVTFKLRR